MDPDLSDVKTNAVHQAPWFSSLLKKFGLWHHAQTSVDFGEFGDAGDYEQQRRNWWDKAMLPGETRKERYRICDEMDQGLAAAILEVWAEETTQPDYIMKRAVWITSKNQQVVQHAEAALVAALIEDRITSIARATAKRGDDFWRTVYKAGVGVQGIVRAQPDKVTRIEDTHSRLVGFAEDTQKYRGAIKRDTSYPWDYIHFRMLGGKGEFTSYGTGIFDTMFQPWKKLTLNEDSVLTYRLRRAPDRNMVLVDVNNLAEDEAVDYVNLFRKSFRKQEFIDPANPSYKKQYNPLTPVEDIFLPIRGANNSAVDGPRA